MASEKRLIDAKALMDLFRRYMTEHFDGEKCSLKENCMLCEARCMWYTVVSGAPSVDAVEVPDAQVRKTVELLCKNYEAAKKKPFVQRPLAYALFHTWKEIDGGGA